MPVKLLTEQHLGFVSLTGAFTGSSESTLVKMPHCWKSHVAAHKVLWQSMAPKIESQLKSRLIKSSPVKVIPRKAYMPVLFVNADALRPRQRFLSHGWTFSCLPGLNQYYVGESQTGDISIPGRRLPTEPLRSSHNVFWWGFPYILMQ